MIHEISKLKLKFEDESILVSEQTGGLLVSNDEITDLRIFGNFIEKQFETEGYYILFVTENIMDEHLRIYLIDKAFKEIDCIEMFSLYSYSGDGLGLVKIIEDQKLAFYFQNEKHWKLTILAKPRRYLFALSPYCITRRNKHLWNNVYMTVTH